MDELMLLDVDGFEVKIEKDVIIECVKSNMIPDEVFDEDQLKEWAANNGYTKV